MASGQAKRIMGTLLLLFAVVWLAFFALIPIMLGSLGMDIHWTASQVIRPQTALLVRLALLIAIPAFSLYLGLRLRRPAR